MTQIIFERIISNTALDIDSVTIGRPQEILKNSNYIIVKNMYRKISNISRTFFTRKLACSCGFDLYIGVGFRLIFD